MEPTNDNEEIRKVLAEFMGFEAVEYTEDKFGLAATMGLRKGRRDYVPDYTEDLNAMHEVEARLHDSDGMTGWHPYILALMDRVDGGGGAEFGEIDAIYRVAHATASERARAAYEVIKAQQGTTDQPTASKE